MGDRVMEIKKSKISCPFFRIITVLFLFFVASSFISFRFQSEEDQIPQMAPVNEEFLKYQKDPWLATFSLYSEEGHPLGLLPSPHDVTHLTHLPAPAVSIESLPASYDSREKNKLTPVKNQGDCGSCWAFATYGSLESYLYPAENWDFSEQNLINNHGLDWGPCYGGNMYLSAAYLTRWAGPIREEDDPYIYAADGATTRKHVQEILFIPPRKSHLGNDQIKQAVMTYGAVYTGMCWKSICYNSTNRTYYNASYDEGGHAICIVGWDDNFDKNKFNTPPPGNGAFIVRNSWGKTWGDGGYFYVSYYDKYFGRREYNVVIKAETPTNYEICYQYDSLGWTNSLGYGKDTAWFANIFTANSTIPLTAVSFYTNASQNSYEIYIYKDVVNSQPRSGKLAATKIGQINSAGYFTIKLNESVSLKLNQKFSVVVKLRTTEYNYPIPMEYPFKNYSSKAKAKAGESFISSTGTTWYDLQNSYANTNVCLKAFGGYPPLYPPLNFGLQRLENDYVFFKEYIDRLSWEANPNNKTMVTKYRLYRKIKGAADGTYQVIAELGTSDFTYDDRGLKKNDLYSYWITAVDEYDRESEPALVSD